MQPLTVPGKQEFLDAVLDYVQTVAEEAGLGKRATYRLRLAVDEIATNIVTHGYANVEKPGNIKVWSQLDAKQLTIYLEDTGVTYDPYQALCSRKWRLPPHERPLNGGLGIYLALTNVDYFSYKTESNHNLSTFIMNRR